MITEDKGEEETEEVSRINVKIKLLFANVFIKRRR